MKTGTLTQWESPFLAFCHSCFSHLSALFYFSFLYFSNFLLYILSKTQKVEANTITHTPSTHLSLSAAVKFLPFPLLDYFLVNYRHCNSQLQVWECVSLKHKRHLPFQVLLSLLHLTKLIPNFNSCGGFGGQVS